MSSRINLSSSFLECQSHSWTVSMFKIRNGFPSPMTKVSWSRANTFSLWLQTAWKVGIHVENMSVETQDRWTGIAEPQLTEFCLKCLYNQHCDPDGMRWKLQMPYAVITSGLCSNRRTRDKWVLQWATPPRNQPPRNNRIWQGVFFFQSPGFV